MGYLLKISQTAQPLVFLMIDAADHVSPKTGLSPTVTLSKNGGSFASPAGAVTEISNGWYKIAGNATDTGTLGPLLLHATGTGADPTDDRFDVVAYDPQDAVRLGMTALPNAAAEAAGGLFTRGTGAGQINQAANGMIDTNPVRLNNVSQSLLDLKDFADDGYDPSTNKVAGVALVDVLTTYTGNTPQTGDSYGRIGVAGAGLTALAPSATALTTATWTNARAGYLDNLNVGGPVASQADVLALNQSASRRIILTTVGQYERPESGNTTYTVEARTYDGDGAAVNADSTPTLAATGIVSGDLSANLSTATNPSTGVYRWTYTVTNVATLEQVRLDVSATLSAAVFTLSAYTQVSDFVSATWTSTDASHLTAIFNKLPVNNIADQTLLLAAVGSPMQAGSTVVLTDASLTTAKLGTFVLAKTTNITGFNDIAATAIVSNGAITTSGGAVSSVATTTTLTNLPAVTTDWLSAAGVSAGAVTKIQNGLALASGVVLSATGLDSVVVESGLNARQALSLVGAALAGILSGAGTATITIKGAGVATTRIVATCDADGNRSALTLTPPA